MTPALNILEENVLMASQRSNVILALKSYSSHRFPDLLTKSAMAVGSRK